MPPSLTQSEARQFRRRWELVEAAEREELRSTSPEQKLRQLAALMASVKALDWDAALQADEQAVRSRWMRLREALRA